MSNPSRRSPIRQASILALGLAALLSAPAAAQTQAQQTWTIDPLRAGYCIEFLVDSSLADRELPKNLVPVGASAVPTLSPALASAVAERPDSFSTWAPSELCFYWSQSITVDGRQVAEKGEDVQTVGVWSILARPKDDPSAEPVPAAVKLFASNWRAAGLGRAAFLDFQRVDAAAGKVPVETEDGRLVPGTEDRYQVKVGKTTLTWDGHLIGDSAAAPLASAQVAQAYGMRQTTWTVRSAVNAEGTRPVAGALRVVGKDALARALQASPIRFVGRWHSGGTAQIVFSR